MMKAYEDMVIMTKLERDGSDTGLHVVGNHVKVSEAVVESAGEKVPLLEPGDKVQYLTDDAVEVGDRYYIPFGHILAVES